MAGMPIRIMMLCIMSLVSGTAADAQTTPLSRDERWREDIRFYSQELPKRHKNLFFKWPKGEFEREVTRLESRVPKLADGEVALELMRITARLGDGHTQSRMPAPGFSFFPLRFEHFAEGWFVVQTTDEYKQALGARLVKIGDVKVKRVAKMVKSLIAADNDLDRENRLRNYFVWAEVLQAKGILKSKEIGTFTFLDRNGKRLSLEIRPVSRIEDLRKIQWLGLSDVAKAPLTSKYAGRKYWFEHLPDDKALYLAYNECANDPDKPFDVFVKEVFAVVDSQPTEKFVVDLRRNSGGASAVIKSLYSELEKRPQLVEKGRLFVLVGNTTFSSAFMNAIEMRDRWNALWVGAPPGQKPNSYGEVRRFSLPHSKIEVQYSTKFHELMKGFNLAFAPVDIAIKQTFADYQKGRDQILQAALSYKAK